MKKQASNKMTFSKAYQEVKGMGGLAPEEKEKVKKAKFSKAFRKSK